MDWITDIDTLSKYIGEEWKKLSESAKEPYNKMAADDRVRYDREMLTYEPSEAYTAAQQAFKAKSKAGGSADAEDDETAKKRKEEIASLKEENKELKKRVKEVRHLARLPDRRSASARLRPAEQVVVVRTASKRCMASRLLWQSLLDLLTKRRAELELACCQLESEAKKREKRIESLERAAEKAAEKVAAKKRAREEQKAEAAEEKAAKKAKNKEEEDEALSPYEVMLRVARAKPLWTAVHQLHGLLDLSHDYRLRLGVTPILPATTHRRGARRC